MTRLTLGMFVVNLLLAEAASSNSPLTATNIILILGALSSSIVAILTVWRTGHKVDRVATATADQDRKLDRIEVLVDGRYGAVLQKLADVLLALALKSGTAKDRVRAVDAQNEADAQAARVNTANANRENSR
jgi:hypothetical protein